MIRGDAVLMLHCPKCDAIFEAHDDAHVETTCPRCGRVVSTAAIRSVFMVLRDASPDDPAKGETTVVRTSYSQTIRVTAALRWPGAPASCAGRKTWPYGWWPRAALLAATRSGKACPWCPYCGRSLKKARRRGLQNWGDVLRKVLLAATVFIGIPTAVIVFVLVVCAPEGNDVGQNAPRSLPAVPDQPRAIRPGEKPEVASVDPVAPKRSPLSALRSLRKWLRRTEQGTRPPAKGSIGERRSGRT